MRRTAKPLAVGAALAACAAAAGPGSSALAATGATGTPSAPSFVPCQQRFSCATLAVPLDRSGAVAGTVSLHLARLLSGQRPAREAIVALAGGPGQAALPLAGSFAQTVAPALSGRDLVVFDQRGTGQSNPLSCNALRSAGGTTLASAQRALAHCAQQIGAARQGFTTAESVQDIEAIREALGYEKLVLYGTSYGTKVALEYAERYPQYVESLVLDSVVPPNGPNAFELPSFAAITPVLQELCSHGACRGVTAAPVGDLARLAHRLAGRPLRGIVYNGRGRRARVSVGASALFSLLEAGDLNPTLRAFFPAAVSAALHGDPAPLLQLYALAAGLLPSMPRSPGQPVEAAVDEALFWTTSCEEDPFPWQRTGDAEIRDAEALSALAATPAHDFYPFGAGIALQAGPMLGCLDWPDAAPAPQLGGSLPTVPTLILSGGQDLRTPTAQARRVAATIPGAQLVVVPYTGHSVLGSDLSGCAAQALQEFFSGLPATSCAGAHDTFAPTAIPPASLSAVHAAPGLAGGPGRTLTAALETVLDVKRLVIAATLQADQSLPAGAGLGGLRGGYAVLRSATTVSLQHFSFVPGLALTGTLPIVLRSGTTGPLRVEGRAAAGGTIQIAASGVVQGRLGGVRVDARLRSAVLARARGQRWPQSPLSPTLVRPLPRLAHIP